MPDDLQLPLNLVGIAGTFATVGTWVAGGPNYLANVGTIMFSSHMVHRATGLEPCRVGLALTVNRRDLRTLYSPGSYKDRHGARSRRGAVAVTADSCIVRNGVPRLPASLGVERDTAAIRQGGVRLGKLSPPQEFPLA